MQRPHILFIRLRDDLNRFYIDKRAGPIYLHRKGESDFRQVVSIYGNLINANLLTDSTPGAKGSEPTKQFIQEDNDKIHPTNESLVKLINDKVNGTEKKEGKNIILFTYGASGSGKTYFSIGPENGPNGLLGLILNELELGKKDFTLSVIELIPDYNSNANEGFITIGEYTPEGDILDKIKWINKKNDNRLTYYTPNNPDSSRSHLMIKITLANDKTITIADLAGLEAPIKLNDQIQRGYYKRIREINNKKNLIYNKIFFYPKAGRDGKIDDIEKELSNKNIGQQDLINNEPLGEIKFKSVRPNKIKDVISCFKKTKIILEQLNNSKLTYPDLFMSEDDKKSFIKRHKTTFNRTILNVSEILERQFSDEDFYMNNNEDYDVEINKTGELIERVYNPTQDEKDVKDDFYLNLEQFCGGPYNETNLQNTLNKHIDILGKDDSKTGADH